MEHKCGQETSPKHVQRHLGVELLRILLMLGILVLHCLGHGGLLEAANNHSGSKTVLWLLESVAYFSVNCFVLITGYFQINGVYKTSKVLRMLLQMVFWSVICYAVAVVVGDLSLSATGVIKAGAPFLFSGYWFVTVYMALYICAPFLNHFFDSLSQKKCLHFLQVITALCAIPFLNSSVGVGSGMALPWFVTLYFWGAYIRKYGIGLSNHPLLCVAVLIGCVVVLWATGLIGGLAYSVVWSYNSIVVWLAAVCCFLLFLKVDIKSNGKWICMISATTLGVYLIHDSEMLRKTFWDAVFQIAPREYVLNNLWLLPVLIIAIFVVCAVLEALRMMLFKVIRVDAILEAITGIIDKIVWRKHG